MQNQQARNLFVGRKKEIEIFERWLADDQAPWILHIHDATEVQEKKGGIGKTWLLGEFARRAREFRPELAIVNVDFFNVADRDRIVIAERAVQSLQEAFPGWSPDAFNKALSEYFGGSYINGPPPEKDADIRIRDALSDAFSLDLQNLENLLSQTDKFLLLFFDTFEVIEDNPGIAVLGSNQTFPDNYRSKRVRAIFAGRNALNWFHQNWLERQQEVDSIALAPFDQEEMLNYIEAKSLYDQPFQAEEVQILYQLTAGRPILIGLVNDVLNHRILSLAELLAVPHAQFEERLVAQVNNLENPLNWVILFMAHVYHRFNMETLDWIAHESTLKYTENVDYQELIQTLPDLSFVRRSGSGDDFVLHDEMRRLVTRYCWEIQDSDRGIRQEISRCIVNYCDQQMEQRLNEQEFQLYTIMKLYHMLFLSLEDGILYFQDSLRIAVNRWRSALARSLLQEIRTFAAELSPEQRYELIFAEARLLRSEEKPQAALQEHARLKRETSAEWFAEQGVEILIEKGRCYLSLSQLREAGECFTEALALRRARGEEAKSDLLLGLLGFIHRRRGELDIAMKFYQECVSIHKAAGNEVAYADTLNNISNVLRLKGRIEEALRICKIGWLLRTRLAEERKTSERAIALSLSTLGLIYIDSDNFVQAEQNLREAFEIYSRLGDKKSIAMGYNRLGRVQLAKGELEQAKELFEKAQEASEEVNPEALITSLNRQGRVLLIQRNLQEAVPFLRRAMEVADHIHDYYQRVESLIALASVLERLEQQEEAHLLWQQVQDISSQENYLFLKGRAEASRGDVYYDRGDYTTAFRHYGAYCQYAVQYNTLEYNKSLRNISDKLLEVLPEAVPDILASLITLWTSLGFENSHPELISACEQIQQFMNL
jgi:tetratricopeptide (TPR) repeat protein